MRVRRPTRVTARGEATRARIVQAAAELLAARGITGTTLEEVMEASRTSKSQFYCHFANKDALIFAVADAQSGRILRFQEACRGEPWKWSHPIAGKLSMLPGEEV